MVIAIAAPGFSAPFDLQSTDCYREKVAGSIFKLTGEYDPSALTPAACQTACQRIEDPNINAAGITQGNICLCGTVTGAYISRLYAPTGPFTVLEPEDQEIGEFYVAGRILRLEARERVGRGSGSIQHSRELLLFSLQLGLRSFTCPAAPPPTVRRSAPPLRRRPRRAVDPGGGSLSRM